MLERVGVDLVLDAGASDGGFASELRDVATGGGSFHLRHQNHFGPHSARQKR